MDWPILSLLVVARIAPLVVLVPGIGEAWMPWRIRAILLGVLSVTVLCVIPSHSEVTADDVPSLIFKELSLGISLALVPAALVMGLRLAADSLLSMTGLGQDDAQHGMASNPISRFYYVLAVCVFFAAGGHRHLLQALLDSYQTFPPGQTPELSSMQELIVLVLSQSFQMGTRAVAPIAASLGIGILTLAAINRAIPQLSYFAVGMSLQTGVMLAALFIFMGSASLLLDAGFVAQLQAWQAWRP